MRYNPPLDQKFSGVRANSCYTIDPKGFVYVTHQYGLGDFCQKCGHKFPFNLNLNWGAYENSLARHYDNVLANKSRVL